MPNRERDEANVYRVALDALTRWLGVARNAVMLPFRRHQLMPDPAGIYQTQTTWDNQVDTIITTLGQVAMGAWAEATDVPPVSRHAFVMAQLAATQNLLVGIPDEVYHLIFAEIVDGTNAGQTIPEVAQRVDRILETSGSQRWTDRARTIAVTETTRAYGAGTLAAGVEQSRVTGRLLRKRWNAERDTRVRSSHRDVDGVVLDLFSPFDVGGFPLMFPGDPVAPPEEVINCRCDLVIVNERGR